MTNQRISLHIISTNRADLGHLEPLFQAAAKDARFDVRLYTGVLKGEGRSDFHASDVVFIQGDRTELLSVARVAIEHGCIIAHAAGGERTKGSTDDRVRDALTKLAHLHYPVHDSAGSRLLDLEEEPWRICVAGEIGVDTIVKGVDGPLPPEIDARRGDYVFAVHPVTARPSETAVVLDTLHRMVAAVRGTVWLVSPNGDPGSDEINAAWDELCRVQLEVKRLPPLTQPQFCTLMKTCGTIVGNSSCLITEAPHLGVLPILIGTRQEGRFPAPSDGKACQRILDHLATCAGNENIRVKA